MGAPEWSTTMTLTVEMFGLSPFAQTNSVRVEVPEQATVQELVAALAANVPSLVGHVIQTDGRNLVENYGFYINSLFVSDDQDVRLKSGDRVVLILLATGG
jgi:hypothetical protein